MVEWKNLGRFPVTDLNWGVVKGKKVLTAEEVQTKELAKKWTYFSSQLFTSPSTNQLLPAGLVPELEYGCRKKVVMGHIAVLFVGIYAVVLSFFLFSGLFLSVPFQFSFIAGSLLIFTCFFIEVWLVKKDKKIFRERALYFNWIKENLGVAWKVWIIIIVSFGIIQFTYQKFSALDNQIVRDYGVMFDQIGHGEYWRFLIGPFFLSNFIHWVSNFLWVFLFFPLLGWIDFRFNLLLLYLSAVLSHVATYVAVRYGVSAPADGITGVSGMIFFAMGFVCSNSLRYKDFYPVGFYLSICPLTLLNLFLSDFFSPGSNVSFEAHLSGLCFGLMIGFLLNPLKRQEVGVSVDAENNST